MQEIEELFCMQYALRRAEVAEIAARYAEALEEDRRENPDMFDPARSGFVGLSGNLHPNATMRALEQRLCDSDPSLLCLLRSLLLVGADLLLDPRDFPTPADVISACAVELDRLERREQTPSYLAQALTEVKAEHQCKRLAAVLARLTQAGL